MNKDDGHIVDINKTSGHGTNGYHRDGERQPYMVLQSRESKEGGNV